MRSESGLSATVQAGRHEFLVDEPVSAGGADAGPNPYDLLLGALGACTAITVSLYARRKGWPLESVEVRLEHDRIHAEDCKDCDTREGMLDQITKTVVLHGKLDEEQRQRLESIAWRCPVQRTLVGEVTVRQKLGA